MVNFDPMTEYIDEGIDCIDEGIDCIDANEDCIEIPVVYDLTESNDGIIFFFLLLFSDRLVEFIIQLISLSLS